MARRKARIPQGKKIQPAVKTIQLLVPAGGQYTCDLSQCASLLNRRFYRQGLNWAVAGFTFFTTSTQSGQISVSKIPDTWISSNSWEKGFRAWQKMNDDALDEAESVKPRFLDFKVFMDNIHHQDGEGSNLLPLMGNPSVQLTAGEWEYSKFVVPFGPASPGNTTDFDVIWTGQNFPGASPATGADGVSLIEGYAASRGLPDIRDPNAPADAADADGSTPENWLSALQNEGIDQDSEVIEDMITENNQAPYPFENAQIPGAAPGTVFTDTQYPGGANQPTGAGSKLEVFDAIGITATTIGGTSQMRGTNFQGGLIRFDTSALTDTAAGNVSVLVHLVAGPHRGYMCQPMQDV